MSKKIAEFVTTEMMSKETGLELRTIQKYCKTGLIKARRFRRLYFVERLEWEEWKARNIKAVS